MHPALQISNLLGEIFGHLARPYKSSYPIRVDYKTCLAAALACKDFVSPALDILWQQMDGIQPLLQLIRNVEHASEGLYPMSTTDLQRLKLYSRRIRHLQLHCSSSGVLFNDIDAATLTQLSLILDGESLLPCLHSLFLLVGQDKDGITNTSPFLTLFIAPTLRNITFIGRGAPLDDDADEPVLAPSTWLFFETVASTCHQLQNMSTDIVLPSHIISCLSNIATLESFVMNMIEPTSTTSLEDIQPLASLSRLQNLMLGLYEQPARNASRLLPPPEGVFSALIDLQLYTDVSTARELFASYQFPNLKKARVMLMAKSDIQETGWPSFLELMVKHAPNIEDLHIHRGENSGPLLAWSSHWPLEKLRLTRLGLRGSIVKSMSNETFSEMASAWPHLQSLRIDTHALGNIDHSALIIAASKLPELQELAMSMRLYEASPNVLSGVANASQGQLKTITFYRISEVPEHTFDVRRVYNIARFLAAFFPNVQVAMGPLAHIKDLQYLPDFLKGLQEDRAQERQASKGLGTC